MSNLAKLIYRASRANASVESIVAEGVEVEGIPTIQTEPAAEITETPQFQEGHAEVEKVTALIESAAQATSAAAVVEETDEVREGIDETIDLAETLNEGQGGVSVEHYPLFQAIVDRYAARCGLTAINVGPGLESASEDGKVRISTAGLEALLGELDSASQQFMQKSQETFVAMTNAIEAAVPEARDRLSTLLGDLQMDSRPLEGNVQISEQLRSALTVDGSVPEDLVTYFATYAELGRQLLGEYLRRAGASAEAISGLLGSLNYDRPEGFWDTLGEVLEKVGDPRDALGEQSMAISLPGSGKLFEQNESPQTDGNPTYVKLATYVTVNAPVVGCDSDATASNEAADIGDIPNTPQDDAGIIEPANDLSATPVGAPADPIAEGEPTPVEPAVDVPVEEAVSGSMKSLTRDQLRTIVKSVIDLLCVEKIAVAVKTLEQNWLVTQATVGEVTQTVRSVTGDVSEALGPQLEIVPRYAKCVHQLSVWPVANYLTNLVFTANAVALLGTEMVTGSREADLKVEETVEPEAESVPANSDDAVDPADPNATALDVDDGAGDTVDAVVAETGDVVDDADPTNVDPMVADPAQPADAPLEQTDINPDEIASGDDVAVDESAADDLSTDPSTDEVAEVSVDTSSGDELADPLAEGEEEEEITV